MIYLASSYAEGGVWEEVRLARELGKPVPYAVPGAAAQPRADSPTLAHVAAARVEADVGPHDETTPDVRNIGHQGWERAQVQALTSATGSDRYFGRRPNQ